MADPKETAYKALTKAFKQEKNKSPFKQKVLDTARTNSKRVAQRKTEAKLKKKAPTYAADRAYDARYYEPDPGIDRYNYHKDRETYDNYNARIWDQSRAWAIKNGISPGELNEIKKPNLPKKRGKRTGQYKGN